MTYKLKDKSTSSYIYIYEVIVWIFTFSAVVLFWVKCNLTEYGSLYIETPDGNLYLSIANNFIENGHFVQTSRPYELNFVVPPGLPAILTVEMFFGASINCIVIFIF